jgi:hypothetical protein
MNIKNHKKTILIIVITLVLFFGYWFFFISNKDTAETSQSSGISSSPINVSNTEYDREFVESLLSLSYINLDVSMFNTRTYQVLNFPEIPFVVNFTRESGRDNPFLPIGVDGANTSSNIPTQLNVNTNTNTNVRAGTSTLNTPVIGPLPATTSTSTVNPIKKNF